MQLAAPAAGSSHAEPLCSEHSDDTDISEMFNAFVARASQFYAGSTAPLIVSLLAAGRFLTGDLAAAELILDHLPPEDFKLDHGAGYCVLAPLSVLYSSLPLPADLQPTPRWLASLPEPAIVRAWLAEHRDKLRWLEAQAIYLPRPREQQGHIAQAASGRVRHVLAYGASPEALWYAHPACSDLILDDGTATVVVGGVRIPIDVTLLRAIDWDDAEYVYDSLIVMADTGPPVRRSIWRRLFS